MPSRQNGPKGCRPISGCLITVKFVKEKNVKAPVSVWLWLVSQRLYVRVVCGHRSILVLLDYLGNRLNANMTSDNQTKMAVLPAVKQEDLLHSSM